MGNFFGIAFGLVLICFGLGAIAGINVWRYFFPVLLILLGFSIIFNQARDRTSWKGTVTQSETNDKSFDYSAVFTGFDRKMTTDNFQGGKINAVFGGANLDLREAKIAKNEKVAIEVNAVFGGVKIIVPKKWTVHANISGVFGGFDNKTITPNKPEGTLILKGSSVFGGGEIVN